MSRHSAEKDAPTRCMTCESWGRRHCGEHSGRPVPTPHAHEWEVEYLPDPMSGGSVVRSGDLRCPQCGEMTRDSETTRVLPPGVGGAS